MDRVCRHRDGDSGRYSNFFEGLIALLRDNYYVATGEGFIVFDVTAWGWVMLIWGALLACIGLALLAGASWARWTSIVLVGLNVFGQLGFLGNKNTCCGC